MNDNTNFKSLYNVKKPMIEYILKNNLIMGNDMIEEIMLWKADLDDVNSG